MEIQKNITQYFKAKTKEILALSEQALCDHNVSRGKHREGVLCQFLRDIFPKRYSIDNGMVYGYIGRSKEADIVIWDELNYPKLKLKGSNIFFSESVKVIIEVKSKWSNNELEDIKNKVDSTINIFSTYTRGLSSVIRGIGNEIQSLKNGKEYHGELLFPNNIGVAAIIYSGGQKFNITDFDETEIAEIEGKYPDIMLFLDAGKIIVKEFVANEDNPMSGYGTLRQVECGDDALLIFTSLLLELLADRSEHIKAPLSLTDYLSDLYSKRITEEITFQITKPVAGETKTLWGE